MKKLTLAGAVLAALFAMSSANAGPVDGKWTVGGTLGFTKSSADFDSYSYSENIGANTKVSEEFDEDLKGAGLKIFGEYNHNDFLSAGVAYNYFDIGSVKWKGTVTIPAGTYRISDKIDATAHVFEVYAKCQYKFERNFAVFAKAGPTLNYMSFDTKEEMDVDSSTTLGFVAGLGAEYKFNNGVAVRAGYDYFYNVGEVDMEDYSSKDERINTHFFYAGASYTF